MSEKTSAEKAFRDSIANYFIRHFVGPGAGNLNEEEDDESHEFEHELINVNPTNLYPVGILLPQFNVAQETPVDVTEKDEIASAVEDLSEAKKDSKGSSTSSTSEENTSDEEETPNYPSVISSMGMSFIVMPKNDSPFTLDFDINYALYKKKPMNEDSQEVIFRRQPHHALVSFSVDKKGAIQEKAINEETPLAKVSFSYFRLSSNRISCTISLINDAKIDTTENPKEATESTIYQPQIKIANSKNSPYVFSSAFLGESSCFSEEDERLALLYRKNINYASGHNVSASWDIDENGIGSLQTEFIPTSYVLPNDFEIPQLDADSDVLEIAYLAGLDKSKDSSSDSVIRKLTVLINLYQQWIDGLKTQLMSLPSNYQSAGSSDIKKCEESKSRMEKGISLLKDPETFTCFQLANEAMYVQKFHDLNNHKKEEQDSSVNGFDYDYSNNPNCQIRWRPFQLAFLLQSLDSMINETSPYHDVVDLIYFPTGGGKTEAYLFLIAFTILLRRHRYKQDSGTAVLMRYTMRMVTSQQFERASLLICALDHIRRKNISFLGNKAISIGLWIGGDHTYNKLNEAKDALPGLREENSKFQVSQCPWCGSKIIEKKRNGFEISKGHLKINCLNPACEFKTHTSLPIDVIDESLYHQPATLIIATVDKFAQLPFKGEIAAFFGTDNKGNRSPDLIIQDEIHLISGPLGTIVGSYETAIDYLCQVQGRKPKIIASTATVRNAKEQIRLLFNRDASLFPAPGLDYEDSFFSRVDKTSPNRRQYFGIMSYSTNAISLEADIIGTLLAARDNVPHSVCNDQKEYDSNKKRYQTLLAFYTSLRNLGRSDILIKDEIQNKLCKLRRQDGTSWAGNIKPISFTSRSTSSEIVKYLDLLNNPDNDIDFVSATNIISVGIDIANFNLMYVNRLPALTSEYIQTTSRAGRGHPALIVTQFSAFSSRDQSFYEQFTAYHRSMGKAVEPNLLTPFSQPAIERTLPALIVSCFRNSLSSSEKQYLEDAEVPDEIRNPKLQKIKDFFLARLDNINAKLGNNFFDRSILIACFDKFAQYWESKIKYPHEGMSLDYSTHSNPNGFATKKVTINLLTDYDNRSETEKNTERAMNSMRNVDPSINLGLKRDCLWGEDKTREDSEEPKHE